MTRAEIEAELVRVRKELRTAKTLLRLSEKVMMRAWTDLGQWYRFARYNLYGEDLGDKCPIPDPPQRPNKEGIIETDKARNAIQIVLRNPRDTRESEHAMTRPVAVSGDPIVMGPWYWMKNQIGQIVGVGKFLATIGYGDIKFYINGVGYSAEFHTFAKAEDPESLFPQSKRGTP